MVLLRASDRSMSAVKTVSLSSSLLARMTPSGPQIELRPTLFSSSRRMTAPSGSHIRQIAQDFTDERIKHEADVVDGIVGRFFGVSMWVYQENFSQQVQQFPRPLTSLVK